MSLSSTRSYDIIVIGGGIAGVSCIETLARECPDKTMMLISASPMLKVASNCVERGEHIQEFDVGIESFSYLRDTWPDVEVRLGQVVKLEAASHSLTLNDGSSVVYGKLCVCTGGKPKLIKGVDDETRHLVLGIRDTETVKTFQSKLSNARRIVVVGNGGIATEMVHEVKQCAIVWAIKHDSISATFFDSGAAQFLMPHLREQDNDEHEDEKKKKVKLTKRLKYTVFGDGKCEKEVIGSALGPDWAIGLDMIGSASEKRVSVEYNCEVERLYSKMSHIPGDKRDLLVDSECWPIYIELTNGKIYGCDMIVSATGVVPNADPFLPGNNFVIAEDGGLLVNNQMQTSESDIYAAGDVCSTGWSCASHWFQMRLWTQARVMGVYAAFSIVSHLTESDPLVYFNFEIFTHVTHFFGHKVVLLGLYNGQTLDGQYEVLVRITPREEFIKVIIKDGKMNGAILIGETDLEETFENLILNQLDLTRYGDDLLNSNIDIEDYFD